MIENKYKRIAIQILFWVVFYSIIAYFHSIEPPDEDPGYKIAPTEAEIQQIELGTR